MKTIRNAAESSSRNLYAQAPATAIKQPDHNLYGEEKRKIAKRLRETIHEDNMIHRNSTRSSAIAKGPRDASCQLKSCQLPRNSAVGAYDKS